MPEQDGLIHLIEPLHKSSSCESKGHKSHSYVQKAMCLCLCDRVPKAVSNNDLYTNQKALSGLKKIIFVWLIHKWPPQYSKVSLSHPLIPFLLFIPAKAVLKKKLNTCEARSLEPKGYWNYVYSFEYTEKFGDDKAIQFLCLCLIYTSKSSFCWVPWGARGIKLN